MGQTLRCIFHVYRHAKFPDLSYSISQQNDDQNHPLPTPASSYCRGNNEHPFYLHIPTPIAEQCIILPNWHRHKSTHGAGALTFVRSSHSLGGFYFNILSIHPIDCKPSNPAHTAMPPSTVVPSIWPRLHSGENSNFPYSCVGSCLQLEFEVLSLLSIPKPLHMQGLFLSGSCMVQT